LRRLEAVPTGFENRRAMRFLFAFQQRQIDGGVRGFLLADVYSSWAVARSVAAESSTCW